MVIDIDCATATFPLKNDREAHFGLLARIVSYPGSDPKSLLSIFQAFSPVLLLVILEPYRNCP